MSTHYRDQLADLSATELDAVRDAVVAEAKRLAKTVQAADDRARERGARERSYGDGYVGQHASTQEARERIGDLIAAAQVIGYAATEAWVEYGRTVTASAEVTA